MLLFSFPFTSNFVRQHNFRSAFRNRDECAVAVVADDLCITRINRVILGILHIVKLRLHTEGYADRNARFDVLRIEVALQILCTCQVESTQKIVFIRIVVNSADLVIVPPILRLDSQRHTRLVTKKPEIHMRLGPSSCKYTYACTTTA